MSNEYAEMGVAELKKELQNLELELEDLRDDKAMMLGQQGQHISSASIIARFDIMFDSVYEKIAAVKKLLGQ